ncbi:MAG: hypothetical protein FWG50_11025 [Kiritimatiellaeota bacterium]|nr:hypothetical protein [Kiritimatiellota bacterium]
MKFKPCFIAPLCLLASAMTAAEQPTRDYTMVDLHNRLTTKLLDVGATSITFSVEWPLDIELPEGWFFLMGKLDIKKRGWHYLECLEVDPTQGKATFEVPYTQLSWSYWEEFKDYQKKAFFAVRVPFFSDFPWDKDKGKYEEDDESDAIDYSDELWWPEYCKIRGLQLDGKTPLDAAVGTTVQEAGQGGAKPSLASRDDKKLGIKNEELGIGGEESGMEGERPREPNAPAGRWLYLAALPLILAALWFLRRRKG